MDIRRSFGKDLERVLLEIPQGEMVFIGGDLNGQVGRNVDGYIGVHGGHGYGPLKNAIDWASRPPNVWADKPAAIVSTGGDFGGGRLQYHLRQIGVYLDLYFINKPELCILEFSPPPKFNSDGNLIDPESEERLNQLLLSLREYTLGLLCKS
ncbi:NADPH:quinone oxidoreductase [Cinnamomum micranthum f. kanehirae]|uniref:NAD(P)H dehydrogenase (quinone) n=1 Tax=Cinnamomum micranthum f. kanehirae TaxID=337451 RepID=A0A443N445_9MAGN|nr:NADPH:quinone oxidoreductase [Cinnamomum micranthum f. kanehirae]